MAAKKGLIMSLNVDIDIQDKMKAVAKKRNISVSKLVRDLVENNLPNAEEEVDVVIFKVPKNLQNADNVKNWFLSRIDAVSKAVVSS